MVARKPHILGKPFPRVEGQSKLTGAFRYVDDIGFDSDLLHVRLLHSPHAHARILNIDASAAQSLPGVHVVITGRDIEGRLGMNLHDRRVLAKDRVRYVGEPVAAIAAESPEIAEHAVELIRVEYEPLPGVFTVEASVADGATLIHPELETYARGEFVFPAPGTNVNQNCYFSQGNLEKGWANAAVVLERTYRSPHVHHVSMEPHGGVAQLEADGTVTMWASTQAPFLQRHLISQALGLAPDQLRVITWGVGGGFGGKVLVSIEAIVVALALRAGGRPVKLVLSRSEEFTSTFVRPGLVARIKMGAGADGRLTAVEAHYSWDCGASGDATADIAWATAYVGTGPYRIPNLQITSRSVYTNHPPSGQMRGNGMAEVHWAIEQHIDALARKLGWDAVAFRLHNAVKGGDLILDGRVMHATGLDQCIRHAADAIWSAKTMGRRPAAHKRRGKGLAAMWNAVILRAQSESFASVELTPEGVCLIGIGGVDVGQGVYTLAVQLAASELGLSPDRVQVSPIDTGASPQEWQGQSSHLTLSTGNAILKAAHAAKGQILEFVAGGWNEPIGNLDIVEASVISYASERSIALTALLSEGMVMTDGTRQRRGFRGEGRFTPPKATMPVAGGQPIPPVLHFTVGAMATEVEVDSETGEVKVLRAASAFDVGNAINPDIVRSQIRGGAMQGLSVALLEHLIYDDGVPLNATFLDYRLATIQDLPQSLEPIIVEVPQDTGPYGARGVGEHSLIPAAPAVANAVYDAVGVRVETLPITGERVWQAMNVNFDAEEREPARNLPASTSS